MEFDSLGISSVNEPEVGCCVAGLHFWNSACFWKGEEEKNVRKKKREKKDLTFQKTRTVVSHSIYHL